MNNSTTTAQELIGKALRLSPIINTRPMRSTAFWIARELIKAGATTDEVDGLCRAATQDERTMLARMKDRQQAAGRANVRGRDQLMIARRLFYRVAADHPARRIYRAAAGRTLKHLWDYYSQQVSYDRMYRDVKAGGSILHERIQRIGRWMHDNAADHLKRYKSPNAKGPKAYRDKLPLYACSGELEFAGLDHAKAHKLGIMRGEWWNLGRDGGGQHELRFLITGRVPDAACSVVSRLGSSQANGGHIHCNAAGDEATGKRVYQAFRVQLAWARFLVPLHRRRHRHASVDRVPLTFNMARSHKFAAISANTWSRTGTIEIRVWPTTNKPTEWNGRAALMQSWARWSETAGAASMVDDNNPLPLSIRSAGFDAFDSWIAWAAANDSGAALYALRLIRAKARRSRQDSRGIEWCRDLMSRFAASGVRVRGFRLPVSTSNQPTASN
jgi:hypothetical protein